MILYVKNTRFTVESNPYLHVYLFWEMKITIVIDNSDRQLITLNFFSNVTLGLNDEEALEAIESTFKQFNTFLDLMQERGYVTISMQDSQLNG